MDTRLNITIHRNNVWSGAGKIDSDGIITDCPAILGYDQDASDETYEAIQDAIADGNDSVERPDGTYSWTIA